jgi:hypothetical protein
MSKHLIFAGVEMVRTLGSHEDHNGRWTGTGRYWMELWRPSKLSRKRPWTLIVWSRFPDAEGRFKRSLEATADTLEELEEAARVTGFVK